MALSERERRLLAEMEAALASDDPRLQSTLTSAGAPARIIGGSLLKAGGLLIAGLALILISVSSLSGVAAVLGGVAGFLIALTGLLGALRSFGQPATARTPRAKGARSSLNSRIQDRWDRRTFE
jgi:hypothetical protein